MYRWSGVCKWDGMRLPYVVTIPVSVVHYVICVQTTSSIPISKETRRTCVLLNLFRGISCYVTWVTRPCTVNTDPYVLYTLHEFQSGIFDISFFFLIWNIISTMCVGGMEDMWLIWRVCDWCECFTEGPEYMNKILFSCLINAWNAVMMNIAKKSFCFPKIMNTSQESISVYSEIISYHVPLPSQPTCKCLIKKPVVVMYCTVDRKKTDYRLRIRTISGSQGTDDSWVEIERLTQCRSAAHLHLMLLPCITCFLLWHLFNYYYLKIDHIKKYS